MSRIGTLPIPIPSGVNVQQKDRAIDIRGPLGTCAHELPPKISVSVTDSVLKIARDGDDRQTRAAHGLTRKLLANIVQGVSTGFTRSLEIVGVGYRAELKEQSIHLLLGYSHPIVYQLPEAVTAKVEKQTLLTFSSSDKQILGEVCAQIRALRPPEPYKGKGIRYSDEHVRRKAGKAAGAAGS